MPATPIVLHDIGGMRIRAYVNADGNEISQDPVKGHPFDPIKDRFGLWEGNIGYAVCISMDVLSGDDTNPHRNERMFLGLGLDDTPGARPGDPVFVVAMAGAVDGSGDDKDMKQVLRITRSKGIELGLPLHGGGNTSATPSRFFSGNGRFMMNIQDDGHVVQYDTHNNSDESTWTAVWSSWNGLMKPLPW